MTHCSQSGDGAVQDVGVRDESGLLQCLSRGDVRRIATRRGDAVERVRGSLQFLDQIRAEATSSIGLSHVHVDVAVRPVVMKQNSAGCYRLAIQLQPPFRTTLLLFSAGR